MGQSIFWTKMKRPFLFATLTLIGLLFGCGEKQPDLSNLITHQSGDIVFDYPGNWKVTEDSITATIHNLFVETPGDAIVIIQSYPLEMVQDLKSFSKDFSEGASLGTPLVSINKAPFSGLRKKWGYDWISEDFEIVLLGESVPHKRIYGSKEVGDRQIFLILQVPEADYQKVEKGFYLIVNSLTGDRKNN